MLERLARRLDLDPRELRDAVWLGAGLFTITCSYTLIKTARDSLFLSELPARLLPFVYLGVGVLTLLVSAVFARVTQRLPAGRSLAGAAIVSAVVLVLFASWFDLKRIWIPAGFYVWVNVYGLILVSQFWSFTSTRTEPREAKRIFGIVGGGGIAGGLVGGVLAGSLGPRLGLAPLTVIGAGIVAVLAPLVILGLRRRQRENGETEQEPVVEREPTQPWRHSYVRWLAMMVLCSVVVTGLLDYQLKLEVQRRYTTAASLSAFFGLFYTVMNVAALVLQLFGTRFLLQRVGAGWSAFLLPAGLLAGSTATLVGHGFVPVLMTRLWDQVCRFSVNKSALEMFYFPLDFGLRRRAKAVIEAGLERFGDGLAGIVIIAIGAGFRESIPVLAGVSLALVMAWLVAWYHVRSAYVRELANSLQRETFDRERDATPLRERGALRELVTLLESPYEQEALHATDLLLETAPRLVERRIPHLLEHGSPRVRVRALELVAARPRTEATTAQIDARIHDPDPLVRVEALRAHLALDHGRPTEDLERYLEDPDPQVRATALRCLMEYAPTGQEPRLRGVVEGLLRGAPADRVAAVEALGYRPAPNGLHDLLTPRFEDDDLEVRRAALRAAGAARWRDDAPVLIRALAAREIQRAARDGLLGYGELIVGTLGDWLIDRSAPIAVRRMIPKVLADIPSQSSVDALFRLRDPGDIMLSYRALKAANQLCEADAGLSFPNARIIEDFELDLRAHLEARLHLRAIGRRGAGEAERFLAGVLGERRDQALNRMFRRLALLYGPPRDVFAAYRGALSTDARKRGNALEFLENRLPAEQAALVVPLLEDPEDRAARGLAQTRYDLRVRGFRDSLRLLVESEDPWLRAVALHVAGVRRERWLLDAIRRGLDAVDERVREAAEWALRSLGEGREPWPAR